MAAPIISGEAETRVQETADDAALSKMSVVSLNPQREIAWQQDERVSIKPQSPSHGAHPSKCSSAIRLGYFNDPFMSYFVRKVQRRSPLINRGYFARVSAIDLIVRRFLTVSKRTGDGRSQVVSLGAGMDSTFFRLWADGVAPSVYFEVDFPDVTVRKAAIIRRHGVLQRCVAGVGIRREECVPLDQLPTSPPHGHMAAAAGGGAAGSARRQPAQHQQTHGAPSSSASSSSSSPLSSSSASASGLDPGLGGGVISYVQTPSGGCDIRGVTHPSAAGTGATQGSSSGSSSGGRVEGTGGPYRLVTADLRDVAAVQASLTAAGLDPSVPTLLLSECVLVYLEPEESCSIIAWAARTFRRSVFVTYEQIRPNDAFGQVMARNLEERGYSLRGLHAFPDIPAQTGRYRELGYGACTVADMNDVYYRLLPRGDVARAERLELFDEVEEWHLMSAHYCIAVAVNELPVAALTQLPVPSHTRASGAESKGHQQQQNQHPHPNPHDKKGSKRGEAAQGGGASTGGRSGIVTDMPPPAPVVMMAGISRGGSASAPSSSSSLSSSSLLTAASSSTVIPHSGGAHLHHPTAHAGLSPKELAAAVVQAHEAAASHPHRAVGNSSSSSSGGGSAVGGVHEAGGGGRGRSTSSASRGRSSSSSSSSSTHVFTVGAALRSASGTSILVPHLQQQHHPGPPPPSPGHMSVEGGGAFSERSSRSRSRSRSLSSSVRRGSRALGDGDAAMAMALPPPASSSGSSSSAVGLGGGLYSVPPFEPLPPGSATPLSSSSPSPSVVLHTAGGSGVHVMAPGDGHALDFGAMAAAEEEMSAARHLREAVGLDVAREVVAAAAAARAAQAAAAGEGEGGDPAPLQQQQQRGRSRSSSWASTSSSASSSLVVHHPPYAPALEGSRAAITIRPPATHYNPGSIGEAARPVSLADVLLPLEQWRAPPPAGGYGHGHAGGHAVHHVA